MIRAAVGLVAVAVLATACSGVPTSSDPQVIGPGVGAANAGPQPTNTPQPDVEARTIVQEFLRANVGEPVDPRGAHQFLTPALQRKWSDRTVTVLAGSVQDSNVSLARARKVAPLARVTVQGTRIGTVAADGAYTPVPSASGGGGQDWSYPYALDPVQGQWRISEAPEGLVVYAAEFAQVYQPVRLYFYDLAEQRLVPDLRYTALTSPQAIASWELNQLVAGPRSQLDNAVRTELPSLSESARPSVTVSTGPMMTAEVPGSSRLDDVTKKRLAVQLLATLGQDKPQTAMTITDGGDPIHIPAIPLTFTAADIYADTGLLGPAVSLPVFYLDGQGRLTGGNGKQVAGPNGNFGRYHLTSVAVAARRSDDYFIAATTGTGDDQSFWIGRTSGLRETSVHGSLTRPSWAPGLQEAWVGDGPKVYRVSASGRVKTVPTGLSHSRIEALRLSPDGSRVALIVRNAGGSSQLWVGAVVRTGSVRIDSAEPITPPDYSLADVAWNDETTLYVTGHDTADLYGIWSVNVDGAELQERSLAGLPPPQAVDAITAAPGVVPWVSADEHVFVLGGDWEGPNHHTTSGSAPVYLE